MVLCHAEPRAEGPRPESSRSVAAAANSCCIRRRGGGASAPAPAHVALSTKHQGTRNCGVRRWSVSVRECHCASDRHQTWHDQIGPIFAGCGWAWPPSDSYLGHDRQPFTMKHWPKPPSVLSATPLSPITLLRGLDLVQSLLIALLTPSVRRVAFH